MNAKQIHLAKDEGDGKGMVALLCGETRATSHIVVDRGTFEAKSLSRCCPGCARSLAMYKLDLLRKVQATETGIDTYVVRLGDKRGNHLETLTVIAQGKNEAARMAESLSGLKALVTMTEAEWIEAKRNESN